MNETTGKTPIIHRDGLENETVPLYYRYPNQTEPQNAYISIDGETGDVRAEVNPHIGSARTFDVFHNRTIHVPINNQVYGADLYEYMLSTEFKTLVQRALDGYSSSHNEQCNLMGYWTDDAQESLDELERCLEMLDLAECFHAEDWIQDDGDLPEITADTTDEQLEKMKNELELELMPREVVVDLYEYLGRVREEKRNC